MAIGSDHTKVFADRLSDLIDAKRKQGKIFKDIAAESGVPTGSLSKYQNDFAEAGVNSLVKLAKYFGVSTDYLLGISDIANGDASDMAIEKRIGLKSATIGFLKWFNEQDECHFFNMLFENGYWKLLVDSQILYYEYLEARLDESDYLAESDPDKEQYYSDLNDLRPTRDSTGPGFYLHLDADKYLSLRLQQINDSFVEFMLTIISKNFKRDA